MISSCSKVREAHIDGTVISESTRVHLGNAEVWIGEHNGNSDKAVGYTWTDSNGHFEINYQRRRLGTSLEYVIIVDRGGTLFPEKVIEERNSKNFVFFTPYFELTNFQNIISFPAFVIPRKSVHPDFVLSQRHGASVRNVHNPRLYSNELQM